MKKNISILILLICIFSLFAKTPEKQRTLELKKSRMHGEDVIYVQNKLLSMGFPQIKSADGSYGTVTAEAVTDLQKLLHFTPSGTVADELFTFFESTDFEFISSVLSVYNENKYVRNIALKIDFVLEDVPPEQRAIVMKNADKKTAFCNVDISQRYYDASYSLFKVDDSTYLIVFTELFPDAPEGLNPWENVRYENKETVSVFIVSDQKIFTIEKGCLVEISKANLLHYVEQCKKYF